VRGCGGGSVQPLSAGKPGAARSDLRLDRGRSEGNCARNGTGARFCTRAGQPLADSLRLSRMRVELGFGVSAAYRKRRGVGYYANCTDTEGNPIGLFQRGP
jgi:hypothetical protein